MHSRDGDPQASAESGAEVAADRRRKGRQQVNPELVPILRGQFDHAAPADPVVGKPGQRPADRQLVLGAIIAVGLLLVGALLRFAV